MKVKSRDYRKLERARNRFKKLQKHRPYYEGLYKDIFMAELNMKQVARWFFTKYPVQLPKLTYNYKQ